MPAITDRGRSTYRTALVMSTHMFPTVADSLRMKLLTSGRATAMPMAAERKFWTASPDICVR